MKRLILLLCLASRLASPCTHNQRDQTQLSTDLAQKQAALHRPVCLIPMNETIASLELPRSVLRLDWMRRLKAALPVSRVSIPGTHDAGTALGQTGLTRCQVLTIPAQLAVGVRAFDIRLRMVGADLGIYHGEESQKLDFETVMRAFSEFLRAHPTEFVVMRVREESQGINSVEPFEVAFERHIAPYYGVVYRATSRTEIPTVGLLRGKILILDNYGKLPDAIDYPNSAMSVQDDYDTDDMNKKFQEIVAKFEDALHQTEAIPWNVNYTSSCTATTDQLANAQAVNAKVLAFLKGKRGNLGLVLLNFPSVDVIEQIIDSNF